MPQDPYEAPKGDDEPAFPPPVLFERPVGLKVRCLFALPSLLSFLILFSLPLLHQLGAPFPTKPGKVAGLAIFGILAVLVSIATTQLLTRPESSGKTTLLLVFFFHLFIQVALLLGTTFIVLIVSQIL